MNEKVTDIFISKLLEKAEIEYFPNGSNIKEIEKALKTSSKKGTGKSGFPEFTAKVEDFIIVIENKAEIKKQAKYISDGILSEDQKDIVDFAENGALHYAKHIVEKTNFKKVFAFGCSGDEKHHKIIPIFVDENGYKVLKEVDSFQNFSSKNIERYYNEQVLGKKPVEILELENIIRKSKRLHEDLRNFGQLGETEKPLVVSAILLALQEKDFSIEQLSGDNLKTDGMKIFDALSTYMTRVEVKPETKKEQVLNQFTLVKDRTILNRENKSLGKTPLRYFTEYLKENILEAIQKNTNEDILGRFYGEFVRYSGGDGQTLGVVLTPKHITEIFCDLIELTPEDNIIDPCCGTGGFLITAMNKMIKNSESADEVEKIKKDRIHGVEIREDMFSIATTNMILRGDGKSNLIKDDFLSITTENLRKNNFTVGFMNPPYSQAKNKKTAHLSEIRFIEHLLDGLGDGGRAVVIVPQSTMVGKSKDDKNTKSRILKNHTLEGVITLNKNTFYGVGTNPCIAIFTAHRPHHEKKYSKFINYEDDGFELNKHVGLIETERAKDRKELLLNCWLFDAPVETKFMVKSQVKEDDEWLHSFYYFNDEIPTENEFEKTINDYLSFEFNMIMQGREYLFDEKNKRVSNFEKKEIVSLGEKKWAEFGISEIFEIKATKSGIDKNKLLKIEGKFPYITRSEANNGCDSFLDIQNEKYKIDKENVITIGLDTQTIFYQPHQFYTGQNIQVLFNENLNLHNSLFLVYLLKKQMVKFNWGGNGATLGRLKATKILLPVNSENQPDYEFMEDFVKNLEFQKLSNYLNFTT
jgi:type I restriction enzyme M protein